MKEIFTVLLSLIGVLLLIYATCRLAKWLNKRVFSGSLAGGGSGKFVTVLEKIPLTNDTYLAVIRAGGRYLLISVSTRNTSLISELNEDEAELYYNKAEEREQGQVDFLTALKKVTADKFKHPDSDFQSSNKKDGKEK